MALPIATLPVLKMILWNGLVVLVCPVDNVPQVSTQLWYHVGSSSEGSSEKGMAHILEHMIFKGSKLFSETDISAVAEKLSGDTNAFTSYDYTGYIFEFPSHHWKEALPLFSECMRNCRFEEQMLNSELKAVVQELKMGRDNYFKTLWQSMLSSIFADHPYHYPVIGFKQDLWNLNRDDIFAFYQKHYVPNNATLVVVGDVDPEEVFALAQETLGKIPADPNYKKKELYYSKDLVSQSIAVYRDVKQPYGLFGFILPGSKDKKQYEIDVISVLLGEGQSSRLYKKLVDELQLVTEVSATALSLEDATLFLVYFCAKDENFIEQIRAVVVDEINDMIENGIPQDELDKAVKQLKIGLISALEKNYNRARMIAESFIMTGDENFIFKMLKRTSDGLESEIQDLLKKHFSVATMHTAKLLPLTEEGRQHWSELQELSDAEDARILNGRIRTTPVEPIKYAHTVQIQEPKKFHFHKPEKYTLSNGIRVFSHSSSATPKIEIVVSLAAKGHYESQEQPGIYSFVCRMLSEGTKKYPGSLFAQEAERYGIDLSVAPGSVVVSMLKEDFEKGLELLHELLVNATFDEGAVEKVRPMLHAQLKKFWDAPNSYIGQIIAETIYKNHPYSKKTIGTFESFELFSHADLFGVYRAYFTPHKARIAIVGDLTGLDIQTSLEKTFGSWTGPEVVEPSFPELPAIAQDVVNQVINRDQVVLVFAGLSIARVHEDFDKLILFDHIFSGSMSSRLFKLREQTGLFYAIAASLVSGADNQPGMVFVKTIVSKDRLEEAKRVITKTMYEVIDTLTEEELVTAKKVTIDSQIDTFSSNKRMAGAFLQIDRYEFPDDYFDTRADSINAITLDQVKEAARKILIPEKMITFQVGRV